MKRNWIPYLKIGISVLVPAGLIIFLILPLYASVKELKTSIHNENILLVKKQNVQNNYSSISRQYNEIQENVDMLDQAFVSKQTATILETIGNIEDLATARKLKQTIAINPIPESSDTATLFSTIKIDLSGTPANIFLFLRDIEDLPYYLNIATVSISKDALGETKGSLEGKIFWQ